MDRKLLDYLPPVLREVDDFQVINEANEPEISLAWDCLGRVMANQFLEDADDVGVSVWEQELCIRPKGTGLCGTGSCLIPSLGCKDGWPASAAARRFWRNPAIA